MVQVHLFVGHAEVVAHPSEQLHAAPPSMAQLTEHLHARAFGPTERARSRSVPEDVALAQEAATLDLNEVQVRGGALVF